MTIKQELKELNQAFYQSTAKTFELAQAGQIELAKKNYDESTKFAQTLTKVLGDKAGTFQTEFNSQLLKQHPECINDVMKKYRQDQEFEKVLKCFKDSQSVGAQVIEMLYPEADIIYHSDPSTVREDSIKIYYDDVV